MNKRQYNKEAALYSRRGDHFINIWANDNIQFNQRRGGGGCQILVDNIQFNQREVRFQWTIFNLTKGGTDLIGQYSIPNIRWPRNYSMATLLP